MNEYSFENNRDSIKHVINRLSDNKNLSEWEANFIKNIKPYYDNENIKTYYDHGGFLSEKQLKKLSDLWERY